MPSIVRRGDLLLAIGTGGASPALSKKLRVQLEETFGPEWAEVLRILREVRAATSASLPSFQERAARWASALDLEEAAALVREGRSEELRERLTTRLVDGVTTP
jgi:precorrin-2 dehydrogenase/sirohydrochlorin ferrochelatase